MPFCTQCGHRVAEADIYCGCCGSKQRPDGGAGAPGVPGRDCCHGISARTAALLCYIPVVGWIPALVVLASARFRPDAQTRFHAFQGLYLFVAWLMVDWVVKPLVRSGGYWFGLIPLVAALKAVLFAAWIWMLVKVSQNENFKLPFLGDLAEKSASEQR